MIAEIQLSSDGALEVQHYINQPSSAIPLLKKKGIYLMQGTSNLTRNALSGVHKTMGTVDQLIESLIHIYSFAAIGATF